MSNNGADGLIVLVILLLVVGGFILWIWALVDAVRVPDDSMYRAGTKIVWVLVIVLTGFIGAIVYLLVGRPSGSAASPSRGVPPPPPPPR